MSKYTLIADNIAFFKLSNSLSSISAPVLNPIFSDMVYTNGKPKNHSTSAKSLTFLCGVCSESHTLTLRSSFNFYCGNRVVLPLITEISLPNISSAIMPSSEVNGQFNI